VKINPLGLFGFHGSVSAAVGEGQIKILRFAYAHTPAALLMIAQFKLKILIYATFYEILICKLS